MQALWMSYYALCRPYAGLIMPHSSLMDVVLCIMQAFFLPYVDLFQTLFRPYAGLFETLCRPFWSLMQTFAVKAFCRPFCKTFCRKGTFLFIPETLNPIWYLAARAKQIFNLKISKQFVTDNLSHFALHMMSSRLHWNLNWHLKS